MGIIRFGKQAWTIIKPMAISNARHIQLLSAASLLGLLLSAVPLHAGLDAAIGKTYPIAERDFLEVIRERLQAKQDSGELAAMQTAMQDKARHSIENPTPIAGITRASKPDTRYYDPSVTASQDIRDADGNIVVKAGTQANPLDYMGLSKVLLFIDARDKQQVRYADHYYKTSKKPVKVILVAGSYMALMRQWQRPVFYDQGGNLTGKFQITHVPALVYQESPDATVLRIDTVALSAEAAE